MQTSEIPIRDFVAVTAVATAGPLPKMTSNAVLSLVQSLAPAVAYKESNLESNKKVWDLYAKVSLFWRSAQPVPARVLASV